MKDAVLRENLMRMIRSFAVVSALVLFSGSALAYTTFTWTNAKGDGRWSTAGNWTVNGVEAAVCPNATDAVILFSSGDWTVTLDTGAETKFAHISKTDAGIATINGTSGSVLKASNGTAGYDETFTVGPNSSVTDGTKLVVNVPVTAAVRMDKWNGGAIEFSKAVTSTVGASGFGFIANGHVTFSGDAVLSCPGMYGCGNGSPSNVTGDSRYFTRFTDNAQITINKFYVPTSGSNNRRIEFEQDGTGTVVNITALSFVPSGTTTSSQPICYRMKAGVLNVKDITLKEGTKSSFIQDGGTVRLSGSLSVTGSSDGYVMNGGTFVNANANAITFPFAGLHLCGPVALRNEGGSVTFDKDIVLRDTLDIVTNEVVIGANVTVGAPDHDYTPLRVNIASGAQLRFGDINSCISRPLDLSIAAGGKVVFPNGQHNEFHARQTYARGMLIAHRLTVGGVAQAKGVYGPSDYFDAYSAASQIVVPYVWTGAAGDGLWDTPANWEGGVLPPGGSADTFVDLSAAEGRAIRIEKAGGYAIGGVIANPSGGTRKVTLTGSPLTLMPKSTLGTVLYVGKGCTLDLDVDVQRSAGTYTSLAKMLGGGTVVFRRGYPDSGNSSVSPFVPNGTFVFAGDISLCGGAQTKVLSLGGNGEQDGYGLLRIVDGAHVTATKIMSSDNSISPIAEIRQTGGTVTAEELNLARRQGWAENSWPYTWYLEGGEINLSTALRLGVNTTVQNDVRPKMSFEMYGGILRTPLIATRGNSNNLCLYDGDVYLGAGGLVLDNSVVSQYTANDPHVYLGATRIHATANWSSGVNINLTAIQGDPEFDTAGFNVTLNGNLVGDGGFIKSGAGTLTVNNVTNTFTGAVRVKAGSVVFGGNAALTAIRSLSVEDGASVAVNGTVAANLASVMLSDASALTLANGADFTTSCLMVGGESKPAGSYTFGAGTVTVAPPAGVVSYIGGNNGSWSAAGSWSNGAAPAASGSVDFGYSTLPQDCTIRLDADVSLASLTYRRSGGGTLTLDAAGGSLTFPANAVITVDEGCTLVIDADVAIGAATGQYVYKKGAGTLVFNGAATGPTAAGTHSYFMLNGGETCFNGATAHMRVMQDAQGGFGVPTIRLGENCVADECIVLQMCWGSNPANGIIVQDGGTYDLGTSPFTSYNWLAQKIFRGRYILNGGQFRTSAKVPSGFDYNKVAGTSPRFDFEQNGGTSVLQRVNFAHYDNQLDVYTLNDGLMSIPTAAEPGEGRVSVNLNGGTVSSAYSGALFHSAAQPLDVTLGGGVTFEQGNENDMVYFDVDLAGAGDLVQAGPGTLELRNGAGGLGNVSVTGGALTLSSPSAATNYVIASGAVLNVETARALDPAACLSLAADATVSIDGDGVTTVHSATYGGVTVVRGMYGAGTGVSLPRGFTGTGTLCVIKGSGGMCLMLR